LKEPAPEQNRRAAYGRRQERRGEDGRDLFDSFEARRDLIMWLNYADPAGAA